MVGTVHANACACTTQGALPLPIPTDRKITRARADLEKARRLHKGRKDALREWRLAVGRSMKPYIAEQAAKAAIERGKIKVSGYERSKKRAAKLHSIESIPHTGERSDPLPSLFDGIAA